MTEDEIVGSHGWHHRLNGPEFEQTLADGEGLGSLCAAVHGVVESWTQLSGQTTTNQPISDIKDVMILYQYTEKVHLSVEIPSENPIW